MNTIQAVTIFGRLGADPELRYTPNQKPVCTFSIAENLQGSDKPIWHRIVVWGKQGEDSKLHLKKGTAVFVRGRNQVGQFDSKDGLKSTTELIAEFVGLPIL